MKKRAADLTSHRSERAKTSSSTGHVHMCILMGGRQRGIAAVNGPTFLSSCQAHVAWALYLVVQNREGLGKPNSLSSPSPIFNRLPIILKLEMPLSHCMTTVNDTSIILFPVQHLSPLPWTPRVQEFDIHGSVVSVLGCHCEGLRSWALNS